MMKNLGTSIQKRWGSSGDLPLGVMVPVCTCDKLDACVRWGYVYIDLLGLLICPEAVPDRNIHNA